MTQVRVQPEIFRDFPSFRRGIVVATHLQNHAHSERLDAMLVRAIEEKAGHPVDLKTDPRILTWNEAHRRLGSNPNKFPPAHAALLKRVQRPGTRIPFISCVVAIMNYHSIASAMPVGGDDLARAGAILELRYAAGSEVFAPLGTPEAVEHPVAGEVIYVVAESNEVMCRRWNWRNGHTTRITEETRHMVMNIDGLGEGCEASTAAVRDGVAAMLEEFCGARVTTALLSPSVPSFQFEV
jgi:lysyl-tRNA synthetase class 2